MNECAAPDGERRSGRAHKGFFSANAKSMKCLDSWGNRGLPLQESTAAGKGEGRLYTMRRASDQKSAKIFWFPTQDWGSVTALTGWTPQPFLEAAFLYRRCVCANFKLPGVGGSLLRSLRKT